MRALKSQPGRLPYSARATASSAATLLLLGLVALLSTCGHAYQFPVHVDLDRDMSFSVPFVMYADSDAPKPLAFGSHPEWRSEIRLEFDVTTKHSTDSEQHAEPKIEALIVTQDDVKKIGGSRPDGQVIACCTESVRAEYGLNCTLDTLFVMGEATGEIQTKQVSVPYSADQQAVQLSFFTKFTDIYYVMVSTCDHDAIRIDGAFAAQNKFGNLPGQLYQQLPAYFALLIAYIIIGVAWVAVCLCNRDEIIQIHKWMTLVVCMGLFEVLLKFIDFYSWNMSDERSTFLVFMGSITSSATMTLAFTLVILVSMGYGVVYPNLGRIKYAVMCFSLTYFVFEALSSLVTRLEVVVSETTPTTKGASDSAAGADIPPGVAALQSFGVLLLLPTAFLQALAYVWILNALNHTIESLTARKQTIKLQLFQNFRSVLVFAISGVALWLVTVILVRQGGSREEQWELTWMMEAAPDVLYLLIFTAILILWRPKHNSSRYAYYEQAGVSALDEDDFDPDFSDDADEEYDMSLGMDDSDSKANNSGIQMRDISKGDGHGLEAGRDEDFIIDDPDQV